jgi:hypothetical protein
MKKIIIILIALFAFLNCNGCGEITDIEKRQPKDLGISGSIYYKYGKVFVNDKEAVLGQQINKYDSIETKQGSMVIVDIKDIGKITLKANTKADFKLYSDSSIEINQIAGTTFSKINKKGINFKIFAPSCVAAVRGTSFEVSVGKTTSFRLLEGKILVAKVDAKNPNDNILFLEPGMKVDVDDKKIQTPAYLKQYEINALSQDNKTLDTDAELIKDPVKPNTYTYVAPRPLTLQEIKKKYGRIALITLFDGKIYTGAFVQIDDIMTIYTEKGTFKVKSTEVYRISVVEYND